MAQLSGVHLSPASLLRSRHSPPEPLKTCALKVSDGENLWLLRPCIDVRPITSMAAAIPAKSLQVTVSSPGGQGISIRFIPCAVCRGESSTEMESLDRRQAGQDHGAFRELGSSANAAEAHRTAGSGGMRRLLQSTPRLVLLPGKRRTGRS